jgi:hypothetical protein
MGKFGRNGETSRHYDHPKLNQEDLNHLNRFITSNEIEAIKKEPPNKENPRFTDNSTRHLMN